MLAVAQERGLTRTRLEWITTKDLDHVLRVCKQFLSGGLPEWTFRQFHQSFVEHRELMA